MDGERNMQEDMDSKAVVGRGRGTCGSTGATPIVRRVLAAGARVAFVLLCLLSPVLWTLAVRFAAPRFLDDVLLAYTSFDQKPFTIHDSRVSLGHRLPPHALSGFRDFCEHMGIETLARIWNIAFEGVLLSAALAIAGVLIHWLGVRFRTRVSRSWAAEAALFFAVAIALSHAFWPATRFAFGFSVLASIAFGVNFVLAERLGKLGSHTRSMIAVGVGVLATAGVCHLLSPVVLLVLVAWCLAPTATRLRRLALLTGQVLACLGTLSVLSLAFLSLRPMSRSPKVSHLLKARDMYDLEIDPVGRRLLVTNKSNVGHAGLACAFNLDNLDEPPKRFPIHSSEVEDIALDARRRRIYHVDSHTKELVVLNADDLGVMGFRQLPRVGAGSLYVQFAGSIDRLFVAWEMDRLTSLDLRTGKVWSLPLDELVHGATNLCLDEVNGVLYLSRGELTDGYLESRSPPELMAIDLRTLEILRTTLAPLSDRMALSARRRELYVSDPWGSSIWVYSTPDLELLRKIPAQFAVRPLAVDDQRGWLLAGGVITGFVDVIELETGRTLERHYVGRYTRRIALETDRRRAFVTSATEGVFLLEY